MTNYLTISSTTEEKTTINDDIAKIIKAIQNYKTGDTKMLDETFGDAMEQELGAPHEITEFIEDGLMYKKYVWNTPHGQFVKIIVSQESGSYDAVVEQNGKKKVKHFPSLQDQLEEALKVEDFEKAIVLRDQIKQNENNPKRRRNPKSK